jgi:hypothetical protein
LMSKSPPARIAWSADCVFGLVQARLAGIQQDRPELTCSVFTVCTVYFALWFVIVQVKMALVIFAFFLHRLYFLRVSLGTKRERERGWPKSQKITMNCMGIALANWRRQRFSTSKDPHAESQVCT